MAGEVLLCPWIGHSGNHHSCHVSSRAILPAQGEFCIQADREIAAVCVGIFPLYPVADYVWDLWNDVYWFLSCLRVRFEQEG